MLGITDKGFYRLSQALGGLSQDEYDKALVTLAAMGYDVESLSEDDVVNILAENPTFLELTPMFNVQGRWIHALSETHVGSIYWEIEDLISSPRELCVTAVSSGAYWEIEPSRRFAVVFEGPCRVLWNADVFSTPQDDYIVKDPSKGVQFLNEVTEGWLTPAECTPIGLMVNWASFKEEISERSQAKIQSISEGLGIPIVDDVEPYQEVVDVDVSSEVPLCEI